MTYDVYAMFKEGNYLVASATDSEHGLDFAERMCVTIGQLPMAFAALVRGEHSINGNIFSINDLKARSK